MAATVSSTTSAGQPVGDARRRRPPARRPAPRRPRVGDVSRGRRPVGCARRRRGRPARPAGSRSRTARSGPGWDGPCTTSPGTAAGRSSRWITVPAPCGLSRPGRRGRRPARRAGPLDPGLDDAVEHGPRRRRVGVGQPLRVEDGGLGEPAQRVDLEQVDDVLHPVPEHVEAPRTPRCRTPGPDARPAAGRHSAASARRRGRGPGWCPTPLWNFCWSVSSSAATATLGHGGHQAPTGPVEHGRGQLDELFGGEPRAQRLEVEVAGRQLDGRGVDERPLDHATAAAAAPAWRSSASGPRRSDRASSLENSGASATMAGRTAPSPRGAATASPRWSTRRSPACRPGPGRRARRTGRRTGRRRRPGRPSRPPRRPARRCRPRAGPGRPPRGGRARAPAPPVADLVGGQVGRPGPRTVVRAAEPLEGQLQPPVLALSAVEGQEHEVGAARPRPPSGTVWPSRRAATAASSPMPRSARTAAPTDSMVARRTGSPTRAWISSTSWWRT